MEVGVGTKWVKAWIYLEESQLAFVLLIGFFEPLEHPLLLVQACMDYCYPKGGQMASFL